ncbi:MAG: hypothetical protein U0519_03155 [Candidatus Gracilibacteria bacterium]
MHSNQNFHPEQGRFLPQRLTYETAPEKPKGESEKPEEKEGKEQPSPRAMLADMSAEIGVEGPMKEMMALERGLTAEGQKAEYSFQNEKLFATREKDRVVWRNEKGEVVQKAVWLKERTDTRTDEHQKNLGAYWTEVSQKYHKDESVRKKAEAQTGTDLQKADGEEIYNLQGGWDKTRMSRMFLGEKMGNGLTFKVDLKGKDKFENYVGAGDILPPTVTKILVIDTKGQQRTGTRQIQNGRVGYYDAQGYIPVFSGYTISIMETISEASAQAREMMMKEQQNHTEMKGTIWRKNDPAPTELGGVSPTSGYRYAMVNGKRVEVKPPRPGEKVYEAKEPAKIQAEEDQESKVEMYQFGKERMYVNAPKDMERFKGKKPEIIFYFHGNGGSIDENLPWITAKVKRCAMKDVRSFWLFQRTARRLAGFQTANLPGGCPLLTASPGRLTPRSPLLHIVGGTGPCRKFLIPVNMPTALPPLECWIPCMEASINPSSNSVRSNQKSSHSLHLIWQISTADRCLIASRCQPGNRWPGNCLDRGIRPHGSPHSQRGTRRCQMDPILKAS